MIPSNTFKTVFAVPTPFDSSFQVCRPALREHLQALHRAGVTSILSNGTTGEFPSLTLAERKMILEICRTDFPGSVMNNIATCCVADSLDLLAHTHTFADAAVLLPPFYFAPVSSEGLKEFLSAVLCKAKIPSYLYNFPRHTQSTISPALVQAIAREVGSLKGIKDSDTGLASATSIKQLNPLLEVFSGNDDRVLEIHHRGLDGVVSGGFNAFPELLCSISAAAISGQEERALKLQSLFNGWNQFCRKAALSPIAAVKLGISTRIPGYSYYLRPPLTGATGKMESEAAMAIASVLREYDLILNS